MQGFCPLFVVSLAPIIAQIAGIALCRNAFWVGQQTLFIKGGIHLNHEGQLLWMRNYIRPVIETLISEFDLTQVQKEG